MVNLVFKYSGAKYPKKVLFCINKEGFFFPHPTCKALFFMATDNNWKLRQIFNSEDEFPNQCQKFFKSLNNVVHKSFKKVRVGTRNMFDKEVNNLIEKQANLRQINSANKSVETEEKIVKIEDEISEKVAKRNADLVKEYVESFNVDGKFSPVGMWKLKDKLIPKESDPPMGKLDKDGILVTSPDAVKSLYLAHYSERLKHRPIKDDFKENYNKKVTLWSLRFEELKRRKSENWSEKDLKAALLSLKTNKTRDPNGLINELFRPPTIGKDLEHALLKLVNGVKQNFFVPKQLQMANITTIYKKKGSRNDLESDRGIFTLSIFRKIIDRLIYREKYPLIDLQMTDSNIGARHDKNIKNHLFIVYAIINDVLKSKKSCVDIQIYDLVKAFDVLWLADCLNDLWDTLPREALDDKLGLVYKTSMTNLVAVNTSFGQTERIDMPEIVTQGGTWGPILCSNSIDKIGKYSLENKQVYKYKNIAGVIPLSMVDDLLAVAQCGFQSVEVNASINTLIELKKLKFHVPEKNKPGKCHFLHIGKPNRYCPGMKVHGVDVHQIHETTYLGDIIRDDGKNSSNIKHRVNKGIGLVSEIFTILESVSFGYRYFEIAKILREARLINAVLTNGEVWYSLGNKEISDLQHVDYMLLRKVMAVPSSACIESFYLELGLIPVSIILKSRRVKYLHYLANQKENSMLYKVFMSQWKYPDKGDWVEEVKSNLKELGINLSLAEIKSKSKLSFKRLVKVKTKEYALEYLLSLKVKHSKLSSLQYSDLSMQKYLKDPKITVNEAKNIFKFRTRTAHFKDNMKSFYKENICPMCSEHPDTQSHSFECKVTKMSINIECSYEEIFKKTISPTLAKTLMQITNLRKNYILSPDGGPRASIDAAV